MSEEAAALDPQDITPEQFAQMVAGASDDQIEEAIRTVGTERTLDRIFQGFEERFQPDKAQGVEADIQFVVTNQGAEHPYAVSIKDGTCTATRGSADSPKVTLTLGLVPFARMVTGQANGMQLFMTGKLKVSGDLMFAPRIMNFFEPPKAA
ncbi:MAG TPA: SCP2 sterol-binding domain-containing protein [Actinomycetota bacterium]